MAKGSVTSCEERLCPLGGGLDNSSKSDLTVQRVLCMGCLNGSLRGGWGAEGIGGGHFQKILDSLLRVRSNTQMDPTLGCVGR